MKSNAEKATKSVEVIGGEDVEVCWLGNSTTSVAETDTSQFLDDRSCSENQIPKTVGTDRNQFSAKLRKQLLATRVDVRRGLVAAGRKLGCLSRGLLLLIFDQRDSFQNKRFVNLRWYRAKLERLCLPPWSSPETIMQFRKDIDMLIDRAHTASLKYDECDKRHQEAVSKANWDTFETMMGTTRESRERELEAYRILQDTMTADYAWLNRKYPWISQPEKTPDCGFPLDDWYNHLKLYGHRAIYDRYHIDD